MRDKQSQFDLLLFDLDGTLIDSVPQLFLAVEAALACCDLPTVTLAQVQMWIGNGADMLLKRAIQQRHLLVGEVDAELFQRVRSAFDTHYHASLSRNFSVFPGVSETLQRLRQAGYRMAVVTNKPAPFVEPLMQAANLLPLFDMLLGGDILPVRKPDPAPLLHICEALQIAPARTLMIGDSKNDVLAAQAAAIPVVGLTYGYNHGESIASSAPDWVMDEFSQLEELLLVN